jgi:hypothetical protein
MEGAKPGHLVEFASWTHECSSSQWYSRNAGSVSQKTALMLDDAWEVRCDVNGEKDDDCQA